MFQGGAPLDVGIVHQTPCHNLLTSSVAIFSSSILSVDSDDDGGHIGYVVCVNLVVGGKL